jgi:hypothetical protein
VGEGEGHEEESRLVHSEIIRPHSGIEFGGFLFQPHRDVWGHSATVEVEEVKKRVLSAAGRAAIPTAAKKRWVKIVDCLPSANTSATHGNLFTSPTMNMSYDLLAPIPKEADRILIPLRAFKADVCGLFDLAHTIFYQFRVFAMNSCIPCGQLLISRETGQVEFLVFDLKAMPAPQCCTSLVRIYSALSARMGSVRVARQAGKKHAAADAIPITANAAPNASGS